MHHRHLLPDEIDLLVDGEAGFGVAPLRAHTAECDACRERVEDARVVVGVLEALPHFAPDSRLADRVMAQVPIFVPAHVAARDSVARWVPQSSFARLAAAVAGTSVAGVLTLALVWLAMRADAVLFVGGMLGDRLRGEVAGAARQIALAVLGESALSALQATGPLGASLFVLGVVIAALCTVVALRRLVTARARRA